MKLWALTNGEFYDEYRVLAICTSEEKANELNEKWGSVPLFPNSFLLIHFFWNPCQESRKCNRNRIRHTRGKNLKIISGRFWIWNKYDQRWVEARNYHWGAYHYRFALKIPTCRTKDYKEVFVH